MAWARAPPPRPKALSVLSRRSHNWTVGLPRIAPEHAIRHLKIRSSDAGVIARLSCEGPSSFRIQPMRSASTINRAAKGGRGTQY